MPWTPTEVFSNPRFVGLWTYRAKGAPRQFSVTVLADGMVTETGFFETWTGALREAQDILDATK